MAKSTQIQSRISTVAQELVNGKDRAEIMRKYAKKWQIAERTIDRYITDAKVEAQSLRRLSEKTATDTIVLETTEAVKSGLKSKLERVLLLQKLVDDIQVDLDACNKSKKGAKVISVTDKAYMRKTIKDIQAEISKIEGDYAPTKLAQTDKEGNDVLKLSKEQIDNLIDKL